MSIKQNGGVFGRNPTFNDVTIEGQLTFDGDIDINSDLKVDGTIEADKLIMEGSGSLLELYRSDANANFGAIELNDTTNTGTNAKIGWNANTLRLEATSTLQLVTNAKTRLQISSTGVQSFFNDSGGTEMYFNGANLVMANGRGIDFSATSGTGTSELLDDYEEGTWTPTLVGSSGGSATMTLSRRTYTKIGNVVHLFMYLSAIDTTAGGFSGAIQIEGLPFSPASGSEQGVVSTGCDIFTTDEQQIGISGQILSDKIVLKKGASTTNYTNSDLASTSSGSFMLHATYRA